jgi:hypothetical protein
MSVKFFLQLLPPGFVLAKVRNRNVWKLINTNVNVVGYFSKEELTPCLARALRHDTS